MLKLAELQFPEVESLARSGHAIIILPVGSVEEHGAHLPLGLDTFAAEAYAEEAAAHLEEKGYTVLLAPAVSYGVALEALSFPGTLTLEPITLRSLIIDIGRSLSRHGFKRQVILNGHYDRGHMTALEEAAGVLNQEGIARVLPVGFVNEPAITAACLREGMQGYSRSTRPDREGHAGEWETSLALHRFPDLVDRKTAAHLEPNLDYDFDAFCNRKQDYWTLTKGRGYFGSPGAATAETGKTLMEVRGRNIAQLILTAFGRPEKNLL